MTRDEFKQLKVGDRGTHPAFIGFLTLTRIETSYDYNTLPPTQWTDVITTGTGDRLLIGDKRDVGLLQKL